MKYSNPAPVDHISPIRRFKMELTLDPQKAILFWCLPGLLILSLLFGGYFFWTMRASASRAADLQDAPLQTAIAAVQKKTPWDRSSKLNPANSGVVLTVNIAGKLATTPDIPDERTFGIRVGDSVQVKYRVGKSNKIYIEEWQPQH